VLKGLKRLVLVAALFAANAGTMRHAFPGRSKWLEQWRTHLIRMLGAHIGQDSFVRRGLYITSPRHFRMGSRCKLGPFARLFLYADLTIGDNVEIGSGLTVHTSEHLFEDPEQPLAKQGAIYGEIAIGSDVYIGSNVTVLAGSTIEDRVVVGAASLVKGRLRSGFLYAGIPAKPIRPLSSTDFKMRAGGG
jgi:maltose O-acetyltransferase